MLQVGRKKSHKQFVAKGIEIVKEGPAVFKEEDQQLLRRKQ
jgi:hypothetical protein